MKVNMNRTKVIISGKSHNGVHNTGHVVFVVEVLVLTVRNGFVSDIAIFVLKRDVKLQLTLMTVRNGSQKA